MRLFGSDLRSRDMKRRRADLSCNDALCAQSQSELDKNLMSSRWQSPIINPKRGRGRATIKQITMTRNGPGFLSRSADTLGCRELQRKTNRTRRTTKIKGVSLLALVFACLCRYSTSSSIAPTLQGGHISKSERRKKNNTGFYYGIRDEHILCSSTSPTCTLTLSSLRQSLSWKPTFDGLVSKLQNAPYQISSLARDRAQWIRQHDVGRFRNIDQQIDMYEKTSSRGIITFLQKLQWRPSVELRQALLENLSQSMQTIASQQWDQYQQFDKHDQDIAVIVGASAKKAKRKKKKRLNNTGFYYGIREDVIILPKKSVKLKQKDAVPKKKTATTLTPSKQDEKRKKISQEKQQEKRLPSSTLNHKKKTASRGEVSSEVSNILGETMLELIEMREEIISLREELQAVKKRLREEEGDGHLLSLSDSLEDAGMDEFGDEYAVQESPEKAKRLRKRDFDRISKEVEKWACNLLFEEERTGNGWKEISCNNIMKRKFNRDGRTQVYLKWMADSRNEQDRESDIADENSLDYPCIKCYSTIDAPMETVCSFLSDEETIPIYNELVVDHDEVEEITPHSKITWTKMPKVLFVKSRDFVTFCSHRWWKDGTQVIINQACEHEDRPGMMEEGQGDATRGFALRGANCECSLFPTCVFQPFTSCVLLILHFSHLEGSK